MRRALELIALVTTSLALVATSRAPVDCATERVTFLAQGACGEAGTVVIASTRDCRAQVVSGAEDAGLPESGNISDFRADSGVLEGFTLRGPVTDGGLPVDCWATPGDGGLELRCAPTCEPEDPATCSGVCTGLLTPVP